LQKKLKRKGAVTAKKNPDAKLTAASSKVVSADIAIQRFHDEHKPGEPEADTRQDYQQVRDQRLEYLEILATVPARSWAGITAKAKALTQRSLMEDEGRRREIGVSLANDVLRHFGALA
jgi:hypothetical protein